MEMRKVCVTGGSGYIGSWLVKKLLEKGYVVHATLRNLDEVSKVKLLKTLPGAETRLLLFQADIYKPEQFEVAIRGCECVFHVATPFVHTDATSQYKNTTEAAIEAAKRIAIICERSESVKRLIYTATVIAASPLKDDGSGFKDIMDESCWTPLDIPIPFSNDFVKDYQVSKTLVEKELLGVNSNEHIGGKLDVVTLACGLVGGNDSLLSTTPVSVGMLISPLTDNTMFYSYLKYMEELIGKVPVVHIDDVCEAHIFCMENSLLRGRFLCANSFISCQEIATFFKENRPEFHVKNEYLEGPKRNVELDSSKLIGEGFSYKYDIKIILDGCISCAQRMGDLQ